MWSTFFRIDDGFAQAGSPITAVARNADHLDLFVTGTDGGIHSTYWDAATGWANWFRIDPDFAQGRTEVSAIARTPDHLDLFVTATDGRVYSVYWDDASGWSTWFPVDPGFHQARSPVAVVARTPDHLDLFVTDNDGAVHTTYWSGAGGWGTWSRIDDEFYLAGPIAAVARLPDHLDLLVVQRGEVQTAYWDAATGWSTFSRIDSGFSTTAGTSVSLAARHADHLDVFVVGKFGGVYTNAWDSATGWSSFSRIDPGFATRADRVTAIARRPDRLDLFVRGLDGGVHSVYWDEANGWAQFFRIDDGFTIPGNSITPIARRPDHLDLFVPGDDGAVHSAYWDPGTGILRKASITFDTHDDDKDRRTLVHVFLKKRLNNSLTPLPGSDYLSNYLTLQRYQASDGDLTRGEGNPFLAYGYALGFGDAFDEQSSHTFPLTLVSDHFTVDDIVMPQVDIHILADGYDQWIFTYTVTLTFDNGSFSFTSAADGVPGIILDQDNRNYSGIGIENPLRTLPIPVPPRATTEAVLTRVTLQLSTHHDNKNADTRLNVHIVDRLNATTARDLAIGLDLFHDQEFPDDGPRDDKYREFIWSAEENTLASRFIRLADMVLPMVYIIIAQDDEDRWIFDYQVTFEFVDPEDFHRKSHVFSSRTSGIVLDQDNNKHAGVYQGRPFPTAAPPTAPKLTYRPVLHTGDNQKIISIPFLRSKFDEFINNRNDPEGGANPPLQRLRLGSTLDFPSRVINLDPVPLPESYTDLQSLANGNDGKVHYVRHPQSRGPLKIGAGVADSYIGALASTSMRLGIEASTTTPVTLTLEFAPGYVWNNLWGIINVLRLSIRLRLTLEAATIVNRFNKSHTIVDAFAWLTELDGITGKLDHKVGDFSIYRYTGTFLHQPIDIVSPASLDDVKGALLDQVVSVTLVTGSPWDPGELIRTHIRDTVRDSLTDVDVLSNRSQRDSINSLVSSWLLGGVADDERNTDENNAWVYGVGIHNANPELGIPEDQIVLDYAGPKNVFVPYVPTDWPTPGNPGTTYDFSPSTLANIEHIVVVMKENRSFDHMLGYLSLPLDKEGMGRIDVDGLKGNEFNSYNGMNYPVFPLDSTLFSPGPPNGYESVHLTINGGRMDGFVRAHAEANSDLVAGQIMGYHTDRTVPVYDALARDFALGHRWFSSHPGPTFPNRFYELTGRPNLDARGFWEFENSSPLLPVFTPTIFDHLHGAADPISGAPVTWRYFEFGYCSLRFFENFTFDHDNIVAAEDPMNGFFACAKAGRLPSVTFIDPHFVDYPPGSNCDEPPSDVADGQALVQRIVEAVVTSPAWNKILLLIVYDEHGGFYDHVPPSAATPVSAHMPILTHGLRVPAFVISPWVIPNSVFGHDGDPANPDLHFDHTSILKTIARRFLSTSPPYMGARYAAAKDLSLVIGNQLHQPQFLPFITYRLQFVQSQMMLNAIQLPDPAPSAVLWQVPGDGTVPQDFSFEDAGNGFVHIRSHVRNLYVTAASADSVVTSRTTAPPGSKWKVSRVGTTVLDRNLFVISNSDYSNLVLQPSNHTSESAVVLAAGSGGAHGEPANAWRIGSPLLGDDPLVLQ